ncbi:MAG: hypothetical protein AB7I04_24015 [Pseudomonadales bacterium]
MPDEQPAAQPTVEPFPYCLCTTVSAKALSALLESHGQGKYRDTHPWLVALDLLDVARAAGQRLPVLFATGQPSTFSHWGYVEDLAVVELHRATWETVLSFSPLVPVNPIWTDLDSVLLKPTAEQLEREVREGIHKHRYPVTEGEIHPYAICETPAFVGRESQESRS